MARVRTEEYWYNDGDNGSRSRKIPIEVSADGVFYSIIPEELLECFIQSSGRPATTYRDVEIKKNRVGKWGIYTASISTLVDAMGKAVKSHHSPKETWELVIKYRIKRKACMAHTPDGDVRPTAHDGAEWDPDDGCDPDGELRRTVFLHDKTRGYSLDIAAGTYYKVTKEYGSNVIVSYVPLNSIPASKLTTPSDEDPWWGLELNRWEGITLDDHESEIPYTAEAAEWFYGVIKGMAQLVNLVSRGIGTEERLQKAITAGTGLLALGSKEDGC